MSKKYKGAIAFDFDGVIHSYEKGWQDGSIYGTANVKILKLMSALMESGHPVFILSTRSPRQIKNWMDYQHPWFGPEDLMEGFEVKIVPFWKKFWNTNKVLGVTNRKLAAIAYIDDRAIRYSGDVEEVIKKLEL